MFGLFDLVINVLSFLFDNWVLTFIGVLALFYVAFFFWRLIK